MKYFLFLRNWLIKYDYILIFLIFFILFCLTIQKQKLEFYSLQNAVVESLVEQHVWGMKGVAYSSNWFFQNLQTKTPQLTYIGDAYEYNGLWYPAKSYTPHYWAAVFYALLRLMGLSFATHYQLVASLLLITSSSLLASIGTALTYCVAKQITSSSLKAVIISVSIAFGSLLSGGINVRNEETFAYWLFTIVYLTTFIKFKRFNIMIWQVVGLYYSVYSLPAATLLLPLGLYRIYITSMKKKWLAFLMINLFCITTIAFHNYLIFGRWVFSNYSIGIEKVAGYKLGLFAFSWPNFMEKIQFYFINKQTSIFINYPLIILAAIGLIRSNTALLNKFCTFFTVLGFIFYITNIGETTGWVGYGSGRYMSGIFPVLYIYLSYGLKKFNFWLWLAFIVAAVKSISTGLFFYFSPIRNVYDRSGDLFSWLPFQGNFFTILAITFVLGTTLPLLVKQIRKIYS